MPRIPSEAVASSFVPMRFTFQRQKVAISQTNSNLNIIETEATTGTLNVVGVVMPYTGSIVAIAISSSANKTAGTLTVTPTINGTAITTPSSLVAVALGNATSIAYVATDAQQQGARFPAGATIGLQLTTNAGLLPAATLDISFDVYVIFDGVQP